MLIRVISLLVLILAFNANAQTILIDIDNYNSLVGDSKGNVVGESVTVLIVEDLRAQTGSRSNLNNSLSLGLNVAVNDYIKQGALGAALDRDGGGVLNRSTSIDTQLTATIIDSDRYGRLYIEGSQSLSINDEKQLLKLEGWVREEDIAPDNTVLSTRLSNAIITIESSGETQDASQPGWFYKFFSFIGLV